VSLSGSVRDSALPAWGGEAGGRVGELGHLTPSLSAEGEHRLILHKLFVVHSEGGEV